MYVSVDSEQSFPLHIKEVRFRMMMQSVAGMLAKTGLGLGGITLTRLLLQGWAFSDIAMTERVILSNTESIRD